MAGHAAPRCPSLFATRASSPHTVSHFTRCPPEHPRPLLSQPGTFPTERGHLTRTGTVGSGGASTTRTHRLVTLVVQLKQLLQNGHHCTGA